MKKLLLLTALLLCALCQGQDYTFLTRLKEPVTTSQALDVAKQLVNASNANFRFYKAKEVKEANTYLVVYAPANMTDEQIIKQKHNDNCFSVYFTAFNGQYIFDKAVVNYADIYPVWHKLFNEKTPNDNKAARIAASDKGVYFSLNQSNPNWIIRR